MMRVLITGGAGFIGSALTKGLSTIGGVQVLVVDNSFEGMPYTGNEDGVKNIDCDICNFKMLSDVVKGFCPTAVVHLAAIHHIPTCESRRAMALESNILGTENLLEAIRHIDCNLIFSSSGAVYTPTKEKLTECSKTGATDIYSLSKLTNERQIELWADINNKNATILRLFNVLGKEDPNSHLLPDVIAQLSSKTCKNIIKLGNIAPRRDYLHLDDVVRAFICVINSNINLINNNGNQSVRHYNVSSGIEYSVEQVVNKVASIIGVSLEIREDIARKRKVDRLHQCGEATKIEQEYGWKVRYDLDQILRKLLLE